jgi:hypothetical protein
MAYDIQHFLMGISALGVAGLIGSLGIHILDIITRPGYVPKKERLRRAALLEREQKKKHGKHNKKQ